MATLNSKKQELLQELGKESIFQAVLLIYKDEGYDGLTMHNVASKAGMATGTIYNYFESKDTILDYVEDRMLKNFVKSGQHIFNSGTPVEKLSAFIKHCFTFSVDNLLSFTLLRQAHVGPPFQPESIDKWDKAVFQFLDKIIEEGIAAGRFRNIDPRKTATCILELIVGIVQRNNNRQMLDPEKHTQQAMEFITPYLCHSTFIP